MNIKLPQDTIDKLLEFGDALQEHHDHCQAVISGVQSQNDQKELSKKIQTLSLRIALSVVYLFEGQNNENE